MDPFDQLREFGPTLVGLVAVTGFAGYLIRDYIGYLKRQAERSEARVDTMATVQAEQTGLLKTILDRQEQLARGDR